MAETVGGDGKLDGNERLIAPFTELAPVFHHIVDNRLAAGFRQELVNQNPLVTPAHQPLRLIEHGA